MVKGLTQDTAVKVLSGGECEGEKGWRRPSHSARLPSSNRAPIKMGIVKRVIVKSGTEEIFPSIRGIFISVGF